MFFKKNNRRAKKVKKKLFIIVIIITIAWLFICLYFLFFVKKPLFISPIPGKLITHSNALESSDLKNQEIRNVEEELKKEGIQYTAVEISTNSGILIFLSEGGEVVFSKEKDLASQITSLQRVLSRFTIEGKKFEFLDFRFDRPFVKLK